MFETRPIFLNCFSRGGSNILWNMFLTHPEVCSPIQETLEIFRFDRRSVRLQGVAVAILSRQRRLFDQWALYERKPISDPAQRYIDRTLYEWKLKTLVDPEMRFKAEGIPYSRQEIERTRMAIKNNNGLTFLSSVFMTMYPDATFIALLRHPLPLFESHKRRQTPVAKTVEQFADFYIELANKMLADEGRWENYHLIRFEDLVTEPMEVLRNLYRWAGLDIQRITKVRFKAKAYVQADGSHGSEYTEGRHFWLSVEEMKQFLEPNVNLYQAKRLKEAEKAKLMELTEDVRGRVGYRER